MQALAKETFYPSDQYDEKKKLKPNAKGYVINPLTSLQLTEVLVDHSKIGNGGVGLSFRGIILCLENGLEDKSLIQSMPSNHHSEVGAKIFRKALLSEEERKNS